MKLFTIQYITAWGKPAEKKLISNHVRNVIAKFERIKPNATIQKVYLSNLMECGWASYELNGGY